MEQESVNDEAAGKLRPHELRGPRLRRTMQLVTLGWFFGAIWFYATAGTALTNYAKALGASNFQFGILAALPYLATLLNLPATLLIEATGRRKLIFLLGLYGQRLMWVPLALLPMWLWRSGGITATWAVPLFMALFFTQYASWAVGGPAWNGWMADIVLPGVRGTYFSRRRQWGLASGMAGALAAGWALDRFAAGRSDETVLLCCAVIFIVASLFGTLDIVMFQWVPEVHTPGKKGDDLFRAWREPLHNRSFLCFVGFMATVTCAISFMGQFATLFVLKQLGSSGGGGGANTSTQVMLIVTPAMAQLAMSSVWGKACDRHGKRPLLVLAGLGLVPVAISWVFVARDTIWLGYLLSVLGGALWAGIDVANFNIILEFAGTSSKTTRGGSAYVGVSSVACSLAGCFGGFAAGAIAGQLHDLHWQAPVFGEVTFFHVLFAGSALLRLLAVVIFLPFLHEPAARPSAEALRYMTSNIYNNLSSAAMQPLRLIGFGTRDEEDERA
jgi:MFS family permease